MNNSLFGNRNKLSNVFLWIIRIWSILSICVLLLFFIGEGSSPSKIAFKDLIGMLLFPLGVVIGMIVGFKKELLGGIITTASLFAFYFIYSLSLTGTLPKGWAFIVISAPGILFLLYGAVNKKIRRSNA